MAKTDPVSSYSIPVRGKLTYTGAWRWAGVPGSSISKLQSIFEESRAAMVELSKREQELMSSNHFTAEGIKAELSKHALKQFEHSALLKKELIKTRQRIDRDLRSLEGVPPRQADDMAGTLQDQELRSWFRGMSGDARTQALAEIVAGRRPELAEAILRQPAYVSGVTEQIYDKLRFSAMESRNRERFELLNEEAEALATAEQALNASDDAIRDISGLIPKPSKAEAEPQPAAGETA